MTSGTPRAWGDYAGWNLASADAWAGLLDYASAALDIPTLVALFERAPSGVRPRLPRQLLTLSRGRDRLGLALTVILYSRRRVGRRGSGSRHRFSQVSQYLRSCTPAHPRGWRRPFEGGSCGSSRWWRRVSWTRQARAAPMRW